MAKKVKKMPRKAITVHEHPMHVPVSKKNPSGFTIRDQHLRRVNGTFLNREEIDSVFTNYDRKALIYPTSKKLEFENCDNYDDIIAVWTDYFNRKFSSAPRLDPDVIKALIASESEFVENPPKNKKAFGITQITLETFNTLQDPNGEVKEFIFKDIRKKDLKDPSINIPMAIRWLFRKKRLAEGKLGRTADTEEIILEYKGLLRSKTDFKNSALEKFRKHYAELKKK
jgi:hypothetical protein